MRTAAYKKQRRKTLFLQQNGLCYWCGVKMILLDPYPAELKRPPGRLCTLDHLRDRFDLTRWEQALPGEKRTVAACHRCNSERGQMRVEELRSTRQLEIRIALRDDIKRRAGV